MRKVVIFLCFLSLILLSGSVLAVNAYNNLHLNLQVTYSNGSIQVGTFVFVFNITNSSDCADANVIYSNSTTLTTDSRGIISYYLQNIVLSDYSQQYWLCYYRDGVLSDTSELAKVPYAFYSSYVPSVGILANGNINLAGYNITANSFFGDGSHLTGVNLSASGGISWAQATNGTLARTDAANIFGIFNQTFDTSTLFINAVNHRVGIGTIIPQASLHVDPNIYVGTPLASTLQLWSTIILSDSVPFTIAASNAAGDLRFETGGSAAANERMRILSTGNVGINTTTPQNVLNVNGNFNVSSSGSNAVVANFQCAGGYCENNIVKTSMTGDWGLDATGMYLGTKTNNDFRIRTNTVNRFYISNATNNGNVGINTTNPSSLFEINGTDPGTTTASLFKIIGTDRVNILLNPHASFSQIEVANSGSPLSFYITNDNGDIVFRPNGVDAMHLNGTTEYVGIGTTNPLTVLDINTSSNGPILESNSTISGKTPRLGFVDAFSTSASSALVWYIDNYATNFRIFTQPNITSSTGSTMFFINSSSGNVGIGTITPTQKLDVAGNVNITSSGNISFGNGGYMYDNGTTLILGHL